MALDRAVQLAREAGEAPPTLRLYRWTRPTVTLGRFQDVAGVDRRRLRRTRASTSCAASRAAAACCTTTSSRTRWSPASSDGVPRGTSASYRMLCGALVEAYRALGVDAALTPRPRGDGSSAACYLHATRGRPLARGAQALRLGAGVAAARPCSSTARSRSRATSPARPASFGFARRDAARLADADRDHRRVARPIGRLATSW